MKRFILSLVAATVLSIGLAAPASALPQPYPNFWPQNQEITYTFNAGTGGQAGGGGICTVQFQFGQYSSAAYIKFRVVGPYSNRPSCTIAGQIVFNAGSGEQSYSGYARKGDSLPGGWYTISVNPSYFIRASFNVNLTEATGYHETGWWVWGSYLCPNGC